MKHGRRIYRGIAALLLALLVLTPGCAAPRAVGKAASGIVKGTGKVASGVVKGTGKAVGVVTSPLRGGRR